MLGYALMTLKVVGAGLGRTGTHSLKIALEQLLGGPCYHMLEVFGRPDDIPVWHAAVNGEMPDWNSFLSEYRAAVDWPASAFWREILAANPDAVVLLSSRDTEGWWTNWQDEKEAKRVYEAHNADVRASVPADRLIDYRPGDGWAPICEKLGLPVPAEPFPHVNTTDEFRAMTGMAPMTPWWSSPVAWSR